MNIPSCLGNGRGCGYGFDPEFTVCWEPWSPIMGDITGWNRELWGGTLMGGGEQWPFLSFLTWLLCLQVLVALACDLELDTLPCCAETHKWAWFRRYCMASRVAVALDKRTPLPRLFLDEVLTAATQELSPPRQAGVRRIFSASRLKGSVWLSV